MAGAAGSKDGCNDGAVGFGKVGQATAGAAGLSGAAAPSGRLPAAPEGRRGVRLGNPTRTFACHARDPVLAPRVVVPHIALMLTRVEIERTGERVAVWEVSFGIFGAAAGHGPAPQVAHGRIEYPAMEPPELAR